MVCSVCFDLQLPDHPDAIPRHTVRRYQESGHAGCLACQTVLDAVDTFAPGAVNRLCSNGSIVMSIDEDGYACITLYREETALSPMIKLFRSQGMYQLSLIHSTRSFKAPVILSQVQCDIIYLLILNSIILLTGFRASLILNYR